MITSEWPSKSPFPYISRSISWWRKISSRGQINLSGFAYMLRSTLLIFNWRLLVKIDLLTFASMSDSTFSQLRVRNTSLPCAHPRSALCFTSLNWNDFASSIRTCSGGLTFFRNLVISLSSSISSINNSSQKAAFSVQYADWAIPKVA